MAGKLGKYGIYLIILAVIAAFIIAWRPKVSEDPQAAISSFEECVAAGNPVMESYPRQCNTPDGKHFVETVIPEQ